jgi:hypothetical protein
MYCHMVNGKEHMIRGVHFYVIMSQSQTKYKNVRLQIRKHDNHPSNMIQADHGILPRVGRERDLSSH